MRFLIILVWVSGAAVMAQAAHFRPFQRAASDLNSPDRAVTAALRDLESKAVPEVLRYDTRYLSLHYLAQDLKEAESTRRVVGFVVNSLSRAGRIAAVEPVPGTSGLLLRLNIQRYRWKREVWEKLAALDPYFHAVGTRTEVAVPTVQVEEEYDEEFDWPGGKDGEGKYFPPGRYKRKAKRTVTKTAPSVVSKPVDALVHALDLNPAVIERLGLLTKSDAPILRADWFIVNAFRPPFYYDFLGIPDNEKDFVANVVYANLEIAAQAEKDRRGTVATSGITINNRRLDRTPTFLGGYYWYSTDSETSIDAQNYLEILLDRKEKNFNASEQIFTLSNELQGYALFDNKGVRQDTVPDKIASSSIHSNHDSRIVNGISCTICHNTGILPFRSSFRDIVKKPTPQEGGGELSSPDPKAVERVAALYDNDLSVYLGRDQELYNTAVKKATGGWTGSELSLNLNRLYANYLYSHEPGREHITMEIAARELGVPVEVARAKLSTLERPAIIGLLNGSPIRRDHWEKIYPEAAAKCSIYRNKEK